MFQFIERVTSLPSPSLVRWQWVLGVNRQKLSHQCHRVHNFGTQRNYYMKGWSLFSNKNKKTFRSDVFDVHSESTEKDGSKKTENFVRLWMCRFSLNSFTVSQGHYVMTTWWQIDMGAQSRSRNHALCAIQNQIKINGKRFSMDITHATPQLNQNSMSHSVFSFLSMLSARVSQTVERIFVSMEIGRQNNERYTFYFIILK